MAQILKHPSSEHHNQASAHHHAATHHHHQAAHHHDFGEHKEAKEHAAAALEHSELAPKHTTTTVILKNERGGERTYKHRAESSVFLDASGGSLARRLNSPLSPVFPSPRARTGLAVLPLVSGAWGWPCDR